MKTIQKNTRQKQKTGIEAAIETVLDLASQDIQEFHKLAHDDQDKENAESNSEAYEMAEPIILAAPAMLEALKVALRYLYKAQADGMNTAIPVSNCIRMCETVIKKATGK